MQQHETINDLNQDAGTESVIDCVAFFYGEGRGGENCPNRNKFRCRVSRNEKGLSKLRESISIGKLVTHVTILYICTT